MLHSVTTDKLASLSFHIYFDSSVLFLYLGCLKSLLWLPKRSFFKGCFFHHSFFFTIMKNWALCWNFNKPSLVVYIKKKIYIYTSITYIYNIYIYIFTNCWDAYLCSDGTFRIWNLVSFILFMVFDSFIFIMVNIATGRVDILIL